MEAQLISLTNDKLQLLGCIDYDTAPLLKQQFDEYLQTTANTLLLDMSGVTKVNSGAIALLIDWFKKAKRQGIALQFCHPPTQLVRIAQLTQVDKILNLS